MENLKLIMVLENLRRIERLICPILNASGITLAQMRLMHQIQALEPVASSKLSDHLGISRASVTGQIKELERLGLSESRPHPSDGRSSLISLSDLGRQRFDAIVLTLSGLEQQMDSAVLTPLSDSLEQLAGSLA